MATRGRRSIDRAASTLLPLALLAAIAYFAYSAFRGDYGLVSHMGAQNRIAGLERELAGLKAERRRLELLTADLREETLDLDLLDERLRAAFGHLRADEVLLVEPERP